MLTTTTRVAIVKGMGSGTNRRAARWLRDRSLLAALKDDGQTFEFHIPPGWTEKHVEDKLWIAFGFPQVLGGWVEFVEREAV